MIRVWCEGKEGIWRRRKRERRRNRRMGKGRIITNMTATRPLGCVMSLSEVAGKGALYEQYEGE